MRNIKLEKMGQDVMIATPNGVVVVSYDMRGTKVIAAKSSAKKRQFFIELISDEKLDRNVEGDRAVLFIRDKKKVNLHEMHRDPELLKIIEEYMKAEVTRAGP